LRVWSRLDHRRSRASGGAKRSGRHRSPRGRLDARTHARPGTRHRKCRVSRGDRLSPPLRRPLIRRRIRVRPLLQGWNKLRGLEREYRTGRSSDALALRALLREAGIARTRASGTLTTEAGPPAGSLEETRRVAQNHVIRLGG